MPIPNSVQEFVAACKQNPSLDIYEMFEGLSDAVREEIYAHAQHLAAPRKLWEESEPTRESFWTLGTHYNVQSLIDY